MKARKIGNGELDLREIRAKAVELGKRGNTRKPKKGDGLERAIEQRAAKRRDATERVVIEPLNFKVVNAKIRGTSLLVQNRFASRVIAGIAKVQGEGSVAKSRNKREPKDFEMLWREAAHVMKDGTYGIPATAFRSAMIRACDAAGYKMTKGKMSVFALADGYGAEDGAPLVKITKGKPEMLVSPVRNKGGSMDIRPRPKWDEGWEATVRIKFDADQFSVQDVFNLLSRAGEQVGVCAGRPFSSRSDGCGWGTFEVVE